MPEANGSAVELGRGSKQGQVVAGVVPHLKRFLQRSTNLIALCSCMTAHAPSTDCWAKASHEPHGCALVAESIALLGKEEQGANGTVTSVHVVPLHHVSQRFLKHSLPIPSQTPYLKGIKRDPTSAVSSLVGPGSTVWIQGMMSPLHMHMESFRVRDVMLSMDLDNQLKWEIPALPSWCADSTAIRTQLQDRSCPGVSGCACSVW